jgi:hypothetical protein
MKRIPVLSAAFLLAVVLLFEVQAGTMAQEAPPQDVPASPVAPPKPAGRGYQPFGDDQEAVPDPGALNPDTTPLTGALVPGVGSPEMRHSYWVPGIQYGNFVRSSGVTQPVGSDWNTTSFVAGNLSLLENWSDSRLILNYSGGGTFSTDKTQGNDYFHQLDVVQQFNWRGWQLVFVDDFGYLPEAQFGFGAASSLAAPGIGGLLGISSPGLQTNYQPSQSIFAAVGSRYSNSITTQVAYLVSPRGSITLAGSYGILRFVQSGNINSNDSIFSAGYNYALSKNDTIGVQYRFSAYRYLGDPQAIQDHTAQFAYGRKLTGRLALQLFAGPELTAFRVHGPGLTDRTSVSGGANLNYALSRANLSASYNHGVSGGSGVFAGSTADQLQGGINRQLSRVWAGNISFGYARNSALQISNVASASPTFNSWFAGGGLQRPLGRTANMTVGYTAYLQDATGASCSTGTCSSYLQHQVSVSFQWHARPMVLR